MRAVKGFEGLAVRRALALLMVTLCGVVLLAGAGCGASRQKASQENADRTVNAESAEAPQEQTGQPAETTLPTPAPIPPPAPESGGNTSFSLEGQSIGDVYLPAPRIVDIRWGDHQGYLRFVFEFRNADGSEVTIVPRAHTWYPRAFCDEYHVICIAFDGVATRHYDLDEFAAGGASVDPGLPLVERIYRWDTADGEPVTFEIECMHSPAHPGVSARPHRLMYMTSPMRIILDIQKQ